VTVFFLVPQTERARERERDTHTQTKSPRERDRRERGEEEREKEKRQRESERVSWYFPAIQTTFSNNDTNALLCKELAHRTLNSLTESAKLV
jgi:hypothetical protein